MSKKPRAIVLTLGCVSFLTDVASDMIYPLLPAFLAGVLGAGPAALGVVEGVAQATASLTQIVSGWWADRARRRKPLVVAGYTLAAIVRPLVSLATHWTQVVAIRFADRIGKGIRTAPRDALIADLVPAAERARAFGVQRAMDNAGAFVGPLLAAFLLRFVTGEVRTVFLIAAIPGFLGVALLVAGVPDARVEPRPAARAAALPLSGRFYALLAVFMVFTLANSTDAFLLLRARDCGVPVWHIPLLWAFFHAVKAVFGIPGGALADRVGRVPAIVLGWGIYAVSYLGFAYAVNATTMWALFALYALYYALTEGAERALVADLVPADARGRAYGFFHASLGVAALPASILFGLWWKYLGARGAFLIGSGLALTAMLALLAWRVTQQRTR